MAVEELPDVLEHQASSDAMNLATKADVLPLALEMANSIKARNRAEKLLADQAVAMHTLAMNFAHRANNEIDRANRYAESGQTQHRQIANLEAARASNSAARAMSAFNDALLTLQKLRTGGKQKVAVVHQYVAVSDGGKAVVARNLKARGRGSKQRGGEVGMTNQHYRPDCRKGLKYSNAAPRCQAHCRRSKRPCQAPAIRGRRACRLHGGKGGAPKGERNGAYQHGQHTMEAKAERR